MLCVFVCVAKLFTNTHHRHTRHTEPFAPLPPRVPLVHVQTCACVLCVFVHKCYVWICLLQHIPYPIIMPHQVIEYIVSSCALCCAYVVPFPFPVGTIPPSVPYSIIASVQYYDDTPPPQPPQQFSRRADGTRVCVSGCWGNGRPPCAVECQRALNCRIISIIFNISAFIIVCPVFVRLSVSHNIAPASVHAHV